MQDQTEPINQLQLPYTVREAAELAGCSTSHIRDEIHAGRLKAAHKRGCAKVWYIKPEWLTEWADTMLDES